MFLEHAFVVLNLDVVHALCNLPISKATGSTELLGQISKQGRGLPLGIAGPDTVGEVLLVRGSDPLAPRVGATALDAFKFAPIVQTTDVFVM